jgi:hypothetical protein
MGTAMVVAGWRCWVVGYTPSISQESGNDRKKQGYLIIRVCGIQHFDETTGPATACLTVGGQTMWPKGRTIVTRSVGSDGVGMGRHATSFRFAQCPQGGPKEGAASAMKNEWWENPFPRTGGAHVRLGDCSAGNGREKGFSPQRSQRSRSSEGEFRDWRLGLRSEETGRNC